jgi:hypothetical protein
MNTDLIGWLTVIVLAVGLIAIRWFAKKPKDTDRDEWP